MGNLKKDLEVARVLWAEEMANADTIYEAFGENVGSKELDELEKAINKES